MPITNDFNTFIIRCKKNNAIKINDKSPTKDTERSFHCWIANQEGDIIDDHFEEYDEIIKVRGLRNEPVYMPFNIEKQKKIWRWFKKQLKEDTDFGGIKHGYEYFVKERRKATFQRCTFNVLINLELMKFKGDSNYRIVIGSMGWRYKNSDDVWFEYGDGE